MNKLVSIITPCYNASSYISETIKSVINQTYTNWEMIIVDDCSKDNSAQIIKEFSKYDNRIKYTKTDIPSGSPALPRNIAIAMSKGEYIAFLDSDDLWIPTKLEEQIAFAEEKQYNFIYSNYEKMTWEGKRNNRILTMSKFSTYSSTIKSCDIPCLTVLLKKDIINGICFQNIKKEDYVFWLEVLKKGNIAYNTNKIHAIYRESNISRSSNKFEMLSAQWHILRNIEHLNYFYSIYCIIIYAIKGFVKFLK